MGTISCNSINSIYFKANLDIHSLISKIDIGPSPRMLVANIVIVILDILEHTPSDGISNMWLHFPVVQVKAEIIAESHIRPEVESEYIIV